MTPRKRTDLDDGDRDYSALRRAEAWIFDLDNTLYPASCNLFDQVDRRMGLFIAALLGVEEAEARRVQKAYFRDYGTTLLGLMTVHGVDPADFLEFVHAIDVTRVEPDPDLDAALARLPGRKIVFTNGSTAHAERVMGRLGVTRRFEAVFDTIAAGYRPKPDPTVYRDLVELYGLTPSRTVMVEDMAQNLEPAAAMGMTTVWVETDHPWGCERSDGDHVHYVVDDLARWLSAVAAADGAEPAA